VPGKELGVHDVGTPPVDSLVSLESDDDDDDEPLVSATLVLPTVVVGELPLDVGSLELVEEESPPSALLLSSAHAVTRASSAQHVGRGMRIQRCIVDMVSAAWRTSTRPSCV
jgi:hypothetical protein